MPSLFEFSEAEAQPVLTQTLNDTVVVEPLDGPRTVDDVMDRFPETLYQQGRDTHLYRFLSALCGDAGAALLKKQAFLARLRSEAEVISFKELDSFYTTHFRFRRLEGETYSANADTDSLTPEEWDDLARRDQSYRNRMLDFFTATRLGNSPEGMKLAAKSGSGVDTDLVEHYRYIFDQYSDDKLGLEPEGLSTSTAEYIVIPRVLDEGGVGDVDLTFTTTRSRTAIFDPPTLNLTARPVPAPTGGDKLTVSYGWTTEEVAKLLPAYERNVIDVLDRLGPVGSFASVKEEKTRYLDLGITNAYASSERIHVSRFVEGKADVSWPDVTKVGNIFIQSGEETEAGFSFGGSRELPVVYHTLESIFAYTDKAFSHASYNTGDFFEAGSGNPPYYTYRSEHTGLFLANLSAIYPFLRSLSSTETYSAERAAAVHDTPLVMEGGR